jgi:hypothetical protein
MGQKSLDAMVFMAIARRRLASSRAMEFATV